MFVCQCKAVTDRTIRAAIADGCSTVHEVAMRCGAGSECRACHPLIRALLAERQHRADANGCCERQASA